MRVDLTSGPPWHVTITVEPVGRDLLCRIHGGETHVGAVALAQWLEDRPLAEPLEVAGHKETSIALCAARELCRATRRSVVCVAGIHYDGITRDQIDAIVAAVNDLTLRATRRVKKLAAPSCPASSRAADPPARAAN